MNRKFPHLLILMVILSLISHPAQSIAAPLGGVTTLVSVASDGTQGNNQSDRPSISADGRYVAFTSYSDNLVSGDTNSTTDIFVHDRQNGQIERVSVASTGEQGNGQSYYPDISADGRYVVFFSNANNLVSGGTNGLWNIFVHDRQSGQTTHVSIASDGTQGNSDSEYPSISADGRYVVFVSSASNLVGGDTNGLWDIFVHDRQSGQTTRVSIASDGTQGNSASEYPSISADGRYVVFVSSASNLVGGDTNGTGDIFVHDRQSGQTERVSVASNGTQGNNDSYGPAAISADGRYVAFFSYADNLVGGDTNSTTDIFVHDRQSGQTTLVSVTSDGTQGNGMSNFVSISADGRYVVFYSWASNLVSGDTNGSVDVFVHDRQSGQTTRASISSTGDQGNRQSYYPDISADGRYVAFVSAASNLVSGDTNGYTDIFVHDLCPGGDCGVEGVVLVRDENENPAGGAQVFRNGVLVGTTSADGLLSIPGLTAGDHLAARQQVIEVPSGKNAHSQGSSQNWAYRVYITSMAVPQSSDPTPWTVTDPAITQNLTIKKNNTMIGFNIVVSVEWDANTSYLAELQQGFQRASDYLYDASDGQMLFERVTIYDNNQNMGDADYQVRASNQEWPRANVGGILKGNIWHVYLGRYFDRYSSNQGSWTAPDGYRTQIHEFGHYGLGLYDSYFYYDNNGNQRDSDCTSADIIENQTPNINATLMDWQYNASEFSMQNVSGLWSSQCQDTHQWKKNGQSDWETMVGHYQDTNSPARWELKTPASYGSVVAGPNVQPVNEWSTITIGSDASTSVCEPSPTYNVEFPGGTPAKGANVVLSKADRSIDQGKTDDNGEITVLGASAGDNVVVTLSSGWNELWQISTEEDCSAVGQSRVVSVGSAAVILEPAPFRLDIFTTPGIASNQVEIIVKASVELSGAPETKLTQNGAASAVLVPLSYDAVQQTYTGTAALDANLPSLANIIAEATNTASQTVEVAAQFTIEPVVSSQDIIVGSPDGQTELYLPAGSLSADGRINIITGQIASPFPDGLILIGGPYTIQGSEDLALVSNANLTLYYLDVSGTLNHVDVSSAQIYRWDGHNWIALVSTVNQVQQMVSAPISTFGTYALMAERQEKVFLPVMTR